MKFIIAWDEKGFLKGAGLHHAALAVILIGLGHIVGLGYEAAIFALAWFGAREYKEFEFRKSSAFEVMDFLSPAVVCAAYLVWISL
jgi:hypothetical protein